MQFRLAADIPLSSVIVSEDPPFRLRLQDQALTDDTISNTTALTATKRSNIADKTVPPQGHQMIIHIDFGLTPDGRLENTTPLDVKISICTAPGHARCPKM